MKSRLSSTIWTLVLVNGAVLLTVLALGISAGRQSGGAPFEFGSLPASAILAGVLAIGMAIILAWRLGSSLLGPVQELAHFSERLAAGDPRARGSHNGRRVWLHR